MTLHKCAVLIHLCLDKLKVKPFRMKLIINILRTFLPFVVCFMIQSY